MHDPETAVLPLATLRGPLRGHLSDCVESQAILGAHGVLSLRMALRMVRSFLATAMRTVFFDLPALSRRRLKALRSGLWRTATMAARKSMDRQTALPPPMKALPRHWPDWRVQGA